MRRLVVLAIVSLLGIAPIGIVGRSASAQDSPTPQLAGCDQGGSLIPYPAHDPTDESIRSLPWIEVCKPIHNAEDAPNTAPYEPYAVEFTAQYSATEPIGDEPEDQRTAEFMIVRVMEGSFALEVKPNSPPVKVSTAQDHIETLTLYVPARPYYGTPASGDATLMFNEEVCTQGCPVDPDVPVLLVPGDFAVAEKGAICIYCLLHGNRGLLEVSVLLDPGFDRPQDFTWIKDWEAAERDWKAAAAATSTPSASTEPVVMAWAFFNPGRCDHG
jgi:hypothetical protein